MVPQLCDTDPTTEHVQIEMLRATPAWRKIEMLCEMWETVRQLTLSGLRQRHPDASETELRRRLAGILLGEELAERAYGPLPQKGER